MRLLLIGAPGAGKGTQAEHIAAHFGVTHLSSGDLLRRHVADGTAIGRAAKAFMERGDLVPDAVVMDMLRKPVLEASARGGYVLDGFPRTVEQARRAYDTAADLGVAVQVAVHLDVPRDELVRRLVERGAQSGRTDDDPAVVEHRLAVYDTYTEPLLEYYRQRERLVSVNGARPVPEVTWSVIVQLQRVQRLLDDPGPPVASPG